jgi:hypothetical protein
VPGEESQNYQWTSPALQYSLAIEIAPRAQVDIPQAVVVRQTELYSEMKSRIRLAEVAPGSVRPDGRLPVGSGNTRGVKNTRRFYGR